MSALPVLRKAKVLLSAGSAAADAGSCAHCGDALGGLRVVERRVAGQPQRYCCQGCAFIAEQVALAREVEATFVAAPATAPATPAAPLGAIERVQFAVGGLACGACGQLIEHTLRRLPGVLAAHVDVAAQRVHARIDRGRTDRAALEAAVRRLGYRLGADGPRAARIALLQVLWAWLAMMQVMMLAWPAYVATPGELSADIAQLLRIAQAVLTVPVLLFSAAPLLRAAWSQWRARRIGMDVPVVLGLAVAFAASAWATLRGDLATPVYYDSITMFVAFVLGSRWLQARWLRRAAAQVERAAHELPATAQRCVGYPASSATVAVPADELAVDDIVRVAPGEVIPADGRVLEGSSSVSQAWLTGESEPLARHAGDSVLAGSVNLEQPLVLVVERGGEATSIAALRRLAQDSAAERPATVETAQRIATVFLWIVAGVTLATLAGWWFVDPAQALPHAIAVLVATCPCALALAAPAALTGTQAALARRGVLCTRSAALETLARADVLACDKTGTLTTGTPWLLHTVALRAGVATDDLLRRAAALEALAVHPFAAALQAAVHGVALPAVAGGRVVPGDGVEGTVAGVRLRIGRVPFAAALAAGRAAAVVDVAEGALRDLGLAAHSAVLLADAHGALGLFVFDEEERPGARALLDGARALAVEPVLLSGDAAAPVERRAAALGITTALARLTPSAKRAWVAAAQAQGRRVAMLGDGLNDAPVLAQADVAIALASGSRLAQARADFIVTRPDLAGVGAALALSRRGLALLRQNFAWALAYNVVMIPLAAFGLIGPLGASIGMAASSLLVVANAMRIDAGRRSAAAAAAP